MGLSENQTGRFGPNRTVWLVIFLLAAIQRIMLALVNREANDNHHEVMELLMSGLRSLDMSDCGECFNPKLFYVVCVGVFKAFRIYDADTQIVVAQFLNVAAGLATLWFLWTELVRYSKNSFCLYATFALIALNPRFIGINCQASNDSFAVLFSTVAIVFALRTLRTNRPRNCIVTWLALALAMLTKGTVWPAAVAVNLLFVGRALFMRESRMRYAAASLVTIALCLTSVNLGDYDFNSYQRYAHLGKGQPLHFFERTIVGRPGVISVVDSYLSFCLIDMIRYPVTTHGPGIEQRHRCSLWSQLYGRTQFIHFDGWPATWHATDQLTINIGRLAILFGLPTLGCLLFGMWLSFEDFFDRVRVDRWRHLAMGERYGPLLVVCGYTAFIILFSYNFRDFSAMKIIYILPGLVGFASLFLQGMDAAFSQHTAKVWQRLLMISVVILSILYITDIQILIDQLS